MAKIPKHLQYCIVVYGLSKAPKRVMSNRNLDVNQEIATALAKAGLPMHLNPDFIIAPISQIKQPSLNRSCPAPFAGCDTDCSQSIIPGNQYSRCFSPQAATWEV